jgi:hypothetical protein
VAGRFHLVAARQVVEGAIEELSHLVLFHLSADLTITLLADNNPRIRVLVTHVRRRAGSGPPGGRRTSDAMKALDQSADQRANFQWKFADSPRCHHCGRRWFSTLRS